MKEFINRKKVLFITIISVLAVIAGIYSTYAITVFVSETTPTTYDMALSFDLSSSVSKQVVVAAGKSKVFDITITNPYNDSIKYGVAYTMVSPTTKPTTLTIAQLKEDSNLATGTVAKNATATASLVIENKSSSSATVSFSVINGYKNGGDLIIPSGKTLVTGVYELTINNTSSGNDMKISYLSIPTGKYEIKANCNGATMTYDYNKNRFILSAVELAKGITCAPTATSKTRKTLSSYIKDELTGTTQGTGQVVNEKGWRYQGKDPNNYIKFNDEIWRIIGVFDSTSHGQSGEYLTKIIRNDSIGQITWNKDTTNNWSASSLYKLLNGAYYNATNGTSSGYCYIHGSTLTGVCDYRVGGINSTYRPMVKKVIWYLGGKDDTTYTTASFYTAERATTASSFASTSHAKNVTNYIGLMYVSDYGYSSLASSCPRELTTHYLSNQGIEACAGSSWLKKERIEQTITHCTTNTSKIFQVSYAGTLDTNASLYQAAASVRPVLYLDSSVYIISGTGSKLDPYIIDM